jgi:hypothetical protein
MGPKRKEKKRKEKKRKERVAFPIDDTGGIDINSIQWCWLRNKRKS